MFAKQHVLLQAKFSTLTDMTNHPRIINVRRPAGSLYRPSLVTFVLYHPSYGLFVCLTLYIFYKTSDLTNQKSNTKTMTNTRLEKPQKERPRDISSEPMQWTSMFPFFLPSLIFMCMYLQGSIHAVSSFRVLTDGRLTAAVCPRSKWENPTTQFSK